MPKCASKRSIKETLNTVWHKIWISKKQATPAVIKSSPVLSCFVNLRDRIAGAKLPPGRACCQPTAGVFVVVTSQRIRGLAAAHNGAINS